MANRDYSAIAPFAQVCNITLYAVGRRPASSPFIIIAHKREVNVKTPNPKERHDVVERTKQKGGAGKSFVSAQEVAAKAGVSRSAVSRTFTQGASVAPATRQKVLEAAETLGYHVNHLARGLINDTSNIVSLIVTDVETPHQSKMLEALTRRLQMADKVAMVINTSGARDGVEAALRQTLHYRADATVMLSGQPPASMIATCLANGQHVILLNRHYPEPGPETVVVTNRRAAAEAFAILQRAGCEKLMVVGSGVGTTSVTLREEAFLAAAHKAGMAVRVVRGAVSNYRSGSVIARQVLSERDRPDGVFCVTDLIACGFMDTARHEFGIDIPAQMSLVGFDDIEQAGWSSYELTTFRQPVEEIAAYIVGEIDRPGPRMVKLEPARFAVETVWRKTVRAR